MEGWKEGGKKGRKKGRQKQCENGGGYAGAIVPQGHGKMHICGFRLFSLATHPPHDMK
jgi:hypothetical protein